MNRSSWTPFRASVVLAFALILALLSLAVPRPAQAGAAVNQVFAPDLENAALSPLAAEEEEPAVTGIAVSVTQTSATLRATVNPEGEQVTKCEFEYGTTTTPYPSHAPCTPSSLGTGLSPVKVLASVSGLAANTTYHFRISAASAKVASKGADATFTTLGPTPTVSAIEPTSGTTLGGTAVKIKGTGFVSGATVTIGSAATSVVVVSESEITARTAATAAGVDEVVVGDSNGTSTGGPTYTYITPPPTVSTIEPNTGSTLGGTAVKIKGTGFVSGATVTIGSPATSVVVVSESEITARTAATAAGAHEVIVNDSNGPSTGGPTYTYFTPETTVSAIEPSSGTTLGGTAVKIKGTGFVSGATVTIGSPATSVVVVSETEITARTAATAAGSHEVVVTDSNGTSLGGPTYTYVTPTPAPTVSALEPSTGTTLGGTAVTVTGTGFGSGATVTFGSTAATGVVVNSATSITATSPPGSGTVHVTVSTPGGGTSAVGPADEFTYVAPSGGGGTGGGSGVTNTGPPVKPPSTPAGLPAPALTRTANVFTVAGRVSIRLPGSHAFVALSSARQIPYGTLVEAVHGEVSVTAATPAGGTERGEFFDGEFVLSQGSNGRVLATLSGGDFSVCPTPALLAKARRAQVRSKFASRTHLVRRLWAEGHGNFSTKGRYAGAIVVGAQWLTEDMCEGTLILATRERVEVSDLVRHRHTSLQTGGIYTAKPR